MWLVKFPKIRMHETSKGWVLQIQKRKWYGKKYWTHLISVYGITDEPFYFKTYESCLDNAVRYFQWDLMIGTRDLN